MSLNDFIENSDELSLVKLELTELKEINGGYYPPESKLSKYLHGAEFAYLTIYYNEG